MPVAVVVERDRVDRLHFESADSAFLHELHFTFQLRFGYGRAKPPPAHHDAAIIGRIRKTPSHAQLNPDQKRAQRDQE